MKTTRTYTRSVQGSNSEIRVIVDSAMNLITVELHITGHNDNPAMVLDLTPPEAAQLADILPRAIRFRRLWDRRGMAKKRRITE